MAFKTFKLDEKREFMLCPDCEDKFPNSFEGLLAAQAHSEQAHG